ncbi:hypothetical protein KGM_212347 [Danaus plexippus plexippus]|uniref:Uncharacterized protein n=1 Tax=Danaus plexippus plexippus TaxID=278856 RepID=A0A212FLT8_DANPL|nr:hypothetical protein KGM_212347 [Danaus plexippus plexippus]
MRNWERGARAPCTRACQYIHWSHRLAGLELKPVTSPPPPRPARDKIKKKIFIELVYTYADKNNISHRLKHGRAGENSEGISDEFSTRLTLRVPLCVTLFKIPTLVSLVTRVSCRPGQVVLWVLQRASRGPGTGGTSTSTHSDIHTESLNGLVKTQSRGVPPTHALVAGRAAIPHVVSTGPWCGINSDGPLLLRPFSFGTEAHFKWNAK